jgi:hypothetical protein
MRPRLVTLTALAAVQCGLALTRPDSVRLLAQTPGLRGYYLNVASAAGEGPFSSAAVSDLQRLRLMLEPAFGPVSFDVAYEHVFDVTSADEAGFGASLGVETGGEWLKLQGTLASSESVRWRHRIDRLAIRVTAGEAIEISAGRQAISWATTLLLTPADPFAPFTPEEPFREYRSGVDALRARAFVGPFSDVELVVRPFDSPEGTTLTALGRVHSVVSGWELSAWAGLLHDEAAGAVGVTTTFAGAAARAEGAVRREDGSTVVRFSVGLDRSFGVGGRDLYVAAEYQRDGFGAAGSSELPSVLGGGPFGRGELQVLGRHTAALQGNIQLDALWSADLLFLSNLGDPSLLIGPGLNSSVSDEASARAGMFWGLGDESTASGLPGSEYGPVPAFAYVSLSAFF